MSIPPNTVIVFIQGGVMQWAAGSVPVNLVIMDTEEGSSDPIQAWRETVRDVPLEPDVQAALDQALAQEADES